MSGTTTNCECGRPLQAGEVRCPSCERAKHSARWREMQVAVAATVGVVVLAIVTGGKGKPKA